MQPTFWPRVSRWLTLRNSVRAARDPIGASLDPLLARFGDTVRLHLAGLVPMVVTRDPALMQHVLQKNHRRYQKSDVTHGLVRYLGRGLLTNEGADWLRQRRLIQPGFQRQRLGELTRLMRGVADEWLAERAADRGAAPTLTLDAHAAGTALTFRIMARSIFGDSLDAGQLAQLGQWLTAIQTFYVGNIRQPYYRPWRWLSGQYGHHDRLADELRNLVRAAIGRHRAATAAALAHDPAAPVPNDLLQMLLDARYEDTGEAMSDAQLLDELNILLVAGHETSANALAWAWHLLATHPEEQAELLAEIERALPEGAAPEFEDLPRLPYALAVVQEAMRLYPPAWILDRVAAEDDEFRGERIAKGTLFSLYLYGLHRHEALWPAPDEFRPVRFLAGAEPPLPAYGYLPFGGGPRLCVGSQFALTELQLVLVQLVRRYRIEPTSANAPGLSPLITLRPAGPLWLLLVAR